MLDIERIRADTPGCADVIHLNNAGSSLPPRPVVDAVVGYLREEELAGGYEVAAARQDDLDRVYDESASLIGCSADEIAFTSSASESWWRAFTAIRLDVGDRVLVSRSEFQANAFGWLQLGDRGVTVDIVPNTPSGDFDVIAFDEMLDERVALVCLTMISMSNGAVHPAATVGARLVDHRAIYLLDACQAVGQLPIDVRELRCDFLNYTGRKFMRGPRGTGVLYARSGVHEELGPPTFIDGRSATWTGSDAFDVSATATRFEFGECNYAGKVGLAVATAYANDIGLEAIETRVSMLSALLRSTLAAIHGVRVLDEGTVQSGIVTFTIDGVPPAEVQSNLSANGINVSAPGRTNAQLDLGERGIDQVVRAGVHYFNTEPEIDRVAEVVGSIHG